MGMYTEINIAFELNKRGEKEAREILAWMCSADDSKPPPLPDHVFFTCDRWTHLFTCCSYYFPGKPHAELKWDDISRSYFLTARANLKNYGNEIALFMDWIGPYIEAQDGEFVGYSRYEEDDWPVLWHLVDGAMKPTQSRPETP